MKTLIPAILIASAVIWLGPLLWHELGKPIGGKNSRRHGGRRDR